MMLRPRILFPLLVLLSLPLLGQTEVSEFPVSEREIAPMLGYSTDAQVVATDAGFLAFWRTDSIPNVARLSRDGAIEQRMTLPHLASNFVWYDGASDGETVLLSGVCPDRAGEPLCLARFSSAGDFIELHETPIAGAIAPVVASNGESYLVTFSTKTTHEVVAVPVTSDAAIGAPFILGPWDLDSQWTSVAAIGNAYYAAFGSPGEHRLVRISGSGVAASVVLDPPLSFWHQLRIEASAGRLLVVIPSVDAARAAIFDAQLVQTTPWTDLDGGPAYPRIAAIDSGWLLATRLANQITVQAIAHDGGQGPVVKAEPSLGLMDLAARGDRGILVGTTRFPLPTSVRATLFDDRGAIVHPASTISVGPAPQIRPSAVAGNGVILAAWTEARSDGWILTRARLFDAQGSPLVPALSMPLGETTQVMPSVAFNGDSFFVVWSEDEIGTGSVKGARVSIDGRLLDDRPIAIYGFGSLPMGSARTADVSWSGTAWVVVSSDGSGRIRATRVSPGGIVLDATPAEITHLSKWNSAADFAPSIDCNGSECLVAWHGPGTTPNCYRSACAYPVAVWARRISPELTLLGGPAVELTIPFEEIPDPRRTSVAWNEIADSWLVAWSFTGRQRVARDGRLLDPYATANHPDGVSISAIPEREGWRLAWSSGGDVFHGWSRTGRAADVEERFALTARPEKETDAQLVSATRPLAFFVRESSPGSPEVIGRFLDASSAVATPVLELSATRISETQVRLSWIGSVAAATAFRIYRWNGAWQQTQSAGATEGSVTLDLAEGRGAKFLLRAETPSGPVESNVVEIEGDRRRTAAR